MTDDVAKKICEARSIAMKIRLDHDARSFRPAGLIPTQRDLEIAALLLVLADLADEIEAARLELRKRSA